LLTTVTKRSRDTEARMSFLEHLDELRMRLTVSAFALLGGFLVAFAFSRYVFDFIMRPLQQALPPGGRLIYTEPAEAFLLYLKISALAGAIIAAPIVLWQLWLFIAPGLYAKEKRYAIPFVAMSSIFFISGAAFSHYMVFPFAWRFFAGFGSDYLSFMPSIKATFSLYAKMALGMGVVFEMPTLVLFLARMGMITAGFLIRQTKYAILVIFIVAAILTPSPDAISQLLMAGPMILLYGLSILIAWVFGRRRPEEPAEPKTPEN
jgi:sec-independent protein translocase protein TatC